MRPFDDILLCEFYTTRSMVSQSTATETFDSMLMFLWSNRIQTEFLNTAHLAVWLQTPPTSPSRLLWTPWFWRRLIIYYIVLKREIAVGGLIIISRNKTKSISNCRDGDQDGNDSAVRRDHLEGERGLSEGGAGHSQAHWLRWLVQRWVGELIWF